MNIWAFTGNLGNDAESRYTPNGDAVVSFSVGVKSGYGDKASTTWARCSMFGKRGEAVSQYLKKGQLVGVSGEVNNREYTDSNGNKRTSLDVRVNDLTLLGKREGQQEAPSKHRQAKSNGYKQSGSFADDMDSDIPF